MSRRLRLLLTLTALLAVGTVVAAGFVFPAPLGGRGIAALIALLVLAVVSQALGIDIDEGGSRTSFDFVIHLAAVHLVGPLGAGATGGLGALIFQAAFSEKPAHKYLFNTCQITLAATAAGLVYLWAGGVPSLEALGFPYSLVPFIAAAATYSTVNIVAVTSVVAVEKDTSILETVRNLKGPIVLFDLAFSLIGYGIAAVYVLAGQWGPVVLGAALVPLLGLRYFYGINIELRNLSKDLTRVLVRTIEAQDPYTSGHSLRVSDYARRIAEEMGLGYERIHQIETAALLHDIGKIDRAYRTILTQEGPLTDRQRELIHAHPERGAELLEPVRSLDEGVMAMIRHHHERWDGDGYPDGIGAEEIPVGARIIMVADTVDAMMTSRSYRDPLDPEDVRRELRMLKQEQFDPDVVDAALAIGIVKEAAEVQGQEQRDSDGAPPEDPDEAVERTS